MKPLRTKLIEKQKQLGVPWEALERDYLLSWILASIAENDLLKNLLVFKGGTALKKCYFGNYRFSEDLDFTCIGTMPDSETLEKAIKQVCDRTVELINQYSPISIAYGNYYTKTPHPRGQQAFIIRAQFPWHNSPLTNIVLEITADEKLIRPAVLRSILHDYNESLDYEIPTYSLEEIIAEKLRAILQNIQNLEQKGWVRSRARDYYDLWRILNEYKNQLDLTDFKNLVHQKCKTREVDFQDHNSFFYDPLLKIVDKTWKQWLRPLLSELPPFDLVIDELRIQVKEVLK